MRAYLAYPLLKLILLGLLWAFLHHCMGIRILLLDMHIGVELPAARNAKAVMVISLLLTALLGAKLC